MTRIVHVTWSGDGEVGETVRSAVAQGREAGIDARWLMVTCDGRFRPIVERLTSRLRGYPAEGQLGPGERGTYAAVLEASAGMLADLAGSPDLAFLHDPPTAGLCHPLKATGTAVVWVCHFPIDTSSEESREAWGFLSHHLRGADSLAFLHAGPTPALPDVAAGAVECDSADLLARFEGLATARPPAPALAR